MGANKTEPTKYTSTSRNILGRTKTTSFDVNKGTITKSVTSKKGDPIRSKVKNLDSNKVQNRLIQQKNFDEGIDTWDGDEGPGSAMKKGGSVIKGSKLRRESVTNGLRTSRKYK